MPTKELEAEVRIVAEFKAKAGQAGALRAALLEMIGPSNAEPGCLLYELHEDRAEPGHFMFYERWVDAAAIDFHNTTPHLKQLGPKIQPLVAEPVKVTKLQMLG